MADWQPHQLDDVDTEIMRLSTPGIPGSPLGRVPGYGTARDERPQTLTAWDEEELLTAYAAQLAASTGRTAGEVLELAGAVATGRTPEEKADALVALSEAEQETGELLSLAALAGKGPAAHVLPRIPDRKALTAALARLKAGSLDGHSREAWRAHLQQAAKALGVHVDFGDEHGDDGHGNRKARTAAGRGRHRQTNGIDGSDSFGSDGGAPGGPDGGGGLSMSATEPDTASKVRSVMELDPSLFNDKHDQGRKGKAHPSKPRKLTARDVAVAPEDATTEDPHAAIQRYLRMNASLISRESPHGSVRSYPPRDER